MQKSLWLHALKQGDAKAYERLYDLYGKKVYHLSLGILKNISDAEDAVQETFIEVSRSVHRFRDESDLGTWIYRIAGNKALDLLRKQNTAKRKGQTVEPESVNLVYLLHPGKVLENKEIAQIIDQAMEELPERQRIAFTLSKIDGLSYQEIADALQTTIGTVESLIYRARKTLQEKLDKFYRS